MAKGSPGMRWRPVTGCSSVSKRRRWPNLRVVGHQRWGNDDGGRDPGAGQPLGQLTGVPSTGRRRQPPVERVQVGLSCRARAQIGAGQLVLVVAGRRGPAEDTAELRPLAVVLYLHGHPLVGAGAGVDPSGHRSGGAAVAETPGDLAGELVGDGRRRRGVEGGFDHGGFGQVAVPAPGAGAQGDESGEGGVQAGDRVTHPAGQNRRATRPAGEGGHAGQRLHGLREAGTVAPRSVQAERRHAHQVHAGIDPVQPVPVQAELFHHPGRVVLEDQVGGGQQAKGHVAAGGFGPGRA